mgnify:CR=1 FL=1
MIETLYIPTMGRTDTQVTYDNLPQKYRDMVLFVIPYHERNDYKYDKKQLLVTPKDIKGIAATREFICRHAGEKSLSCLTNGWMMVTSILDTEEPIYHQVENHMMISVFSTPYIT